MTGERYLLLGVVVVTGRFSVEGDCLFSVESSSFTVGFSCCSWVTVCCSICSCGINVRVKICSLGDSRSDEDCERTTVDRELLFVGDGSCLGSWSWRIVVVVDGINTERGFEGNWCPSSSCKLSVQRINDAKLIEGSTKAIELDDQKSFQFR